MTYRVGAYVWDEARAKVGVVMDERWGEVQLRPVGGGTEWSAQRRALRLATGDEKAAAGVCAKST
ncbi:hypothetical protein ACFWJW_05425 [Streptomyces sp. NPDC127097]|uniref:hypothetical protein n=1 Tax=unclassified Streptomyces TaxID=2593676 RepID=UPI00364B877E